MNKLRIAIPSLKKGGLEGLRSRHFGHCEVFTLIDVEGDKITGVSTIDNLSHSEGGCMVPVHMLEQQQVNALVVGGIGMRPLMGFQQAGIKVYYDNQRLDIRPVVEDLIKGKLPLISENQVCGGGSHCGS